jgi:hypothetical protein
MKKRTIYFDSRYDYCEPLMLCIYSRRPDLTTVRNQLYDEKTSHATYNYNILSCARILEEVLSASLGENS